MKPTKAQEVLPSALLEAVQEYIQGEVIYIPKRKHCYKAWGSCSGARYKIDQRNAEIRQLYQQCMSMEQLAEKYYLSIESIRKIVYYKSTD